MDFSAPQENEKPVEDQVMEFALKKMESYGFHKSRCSEALIKANHDVGKAFEDLMTELFELVYDVPQGTVFTRALTNTKLKYYCIFTEYYLVSSMIFKY